MSICVGITIRLEEKRFKLAHELSERAFLFHYQESSKIGDQYKYIYYGLTEFSRVEDETH